MEICQALSALLENVANLAVAGILTLNIYSATYFLNWSNPESICVNANDTTFSKMAKGNIKVVLVCLPFVIFPLTLCVSGQASALKKRIGGVGFVAGLVILEMMYILCLGGLMSVCMSNAPYKVVLAITIGTIFFVLWLWSCFCYHPRCLRTCFFCCCQRIVDEEDVDLEAGE
uniref:Uncharacterized protein n=1 Tax=Leersia perrieri TaxID=77586 RepID=A0A0D9XUY4_9ORYZ